MAGKPFTHSFQIDPLALPKSIHEPSPKPHGAARLIQAGHSGARAAPRPLHQGFVGFMD
ncbi:hypothetical protein Hanom_Chr11g01030361 [Helianthus anomalus]